MTVRFPAILEDEYGNFVESGSAEIAASHGSINFISGFIPLFKMGTKVTIIRTLRDRKMEVFEGAVYLSSQNLLQINGIAESKMAGIRQVYSSNTRFSIRPYRLCRGGFPRKSAKKMDAVSATVYNLTEKEIKIITIDPITVGQQFILDLTNPFSLHDVLIEIMEAHDFDGVFKAYRCRFVYLPEESQKTLHTFVAEISEESSFTVSAS